MSSSFFSKRWDYLAITGVVLATAAVLSFSGVWSTQSIRIDGVDPISYYSYLHSIFFDRDLHFANEYETLNAEVMAQFLESPSGRPTNCFSIGPSLLLAPAYLGAHVTLLAGRSLWGWETPADGFSYPYRWAVVAMLAVWGWLGLLLLQALLKTWFTRQRALAATLIVLLGTNLSYYLFPVTLMPHALSFFTVTLFLLHLAKKEPELTCGHGASWALSGALLGLAALVRWQNALFGLLPVLMLARALASGGKVKAPEGRRLIVCASIFLLGAALLFSPQMISWRIITGSFITIPQGPDFLQLTKPALLSVLFSTYNGLFTWHPLTLIAMVGLLLKVRRSAPPMVGLLLIFLAEYYLNASVDDWHGSWGFGMRRFVNCTPIFAIGLAVLPDAALLKRLKPPLLLAAASLFIVWNALFLIQYYANLIPNWRSLNYHEFVEQKFILQRAWERRQATVAMKAYLLQKDYVTAKRCADYALQLEPESVDALAAAGFCAMELGEYNQAALIYENLLGIEVRGAHLLALAKAQYRLGFLKESKLNLQRIIKNDMQKREQADEFLQRNFQ